MPKGEVSPAQAHQRRPGTHSGHSAWPPCGVARQPSSPRAALERTGTSILPVSHLLLPGGYQGSCAAWEGPAKGSQESPASASPIVGMILNLITSLVTAVLSSPLVHWLVKQVLLLAFVFLILLAAFAVRLLLLLPPVRAKLRLKVQAANKRRPDQTCRTALFLGSGEQVARKAIPDTVTDSLTPLPYFPRQAATRPSSFSSPHILTQAATPRASTFCLTMTTSLETRLWSWNAPGARVTKQGTTFTPSSLCRGRETFISPGSLHRSASSRVSRRPMNVQRLGGGLGQKARQKSPLQTSS